MLTGSGERASVIVVLVDARVPLSIAARPRQGLGDVSGALPLVVGFDAFCFGGFSAFGLRVSLFDFI
jgi:hypothetical protein